jgi:hypothetical protein
MLLSLIFLSVWQTNNDSCLVVLGNGDGSLPCHAGGTRQGLYRACAAPKVEGPAGGCRREDPAAGGP